MYGPTLRTAFAFLIFSDVAAASTGARSSASPATATPAAVALPNFRKSRRDRLIGVPPRRLPFGAGELVPRAAYDDDPLGTSRFAFELYDVTRIERLKIGARTLVGDDKSFPRTRQVGADFGCLFDSNMPRGVIHGHDDHSILEEGFGEALRHRLVLLDEGGVRRTIVMWSNQICQDTLLSKCAASCEESLTLPPGRSPPFSRRAPAARRGGPGLRRSGRPGGARRCGDGWPGRRSGRARAGCKIYRARAGSGRRGPRPPDGPALP